VAVMLALDIVNSLSEPHLHIFIFLMKVNTSSANHPKHAFMQIHVTFKETVNEHKMRMMDDDEIH